jgi:phosphatidylglycerophosphatase A
MGTLVAVPLSLGLNRIAATHLAVALLILIAAIVFAVWSAGEGATILEQKDPQCIVIDEIVGFLVANFLAPWSAASLLCSFLLFRFFDIAKVFPIGRIERLPGGAGVVLDDVMAGLFSLISLRLLLELAWI